MAHLRAQVILPFTSNLPEDVACNTFHFLTQSANVTEAENIVAMLKDLYTLAAPGGSPANAPIGQWIGGAVSRVANACKIKVYDLAQPKPRPVLHEGQFTMTGTSTGYTQDLPAEVALCATFWGVANRPRTRGRVYLGPWGNHASAAGTNGRSIPLVGLRQSIAASFGRMINIAASTANLAVFSRGIYQVDGVVQPVTEQLFTLVTDGWVDDAWDTQRRRGQAATTRTLFT